MSAGWCEVTIMQGRGQCGDPGPPCVAVRALLRCLWTQALGHHCCSQTLSWRPIPAACPLTACVVRPGHLAMPDTKLLLAQVPPVGVMDASSRASPHLPPRGWLSCWPATPALGHHLASECTWEQAGPYLVSPSSRPRGIPGGCGCALGRGKLGVQEQASWGPRPIAEGRRQSSQPA